MVSLGSTVHGIVQRALLLLGEGGVAGGRSGGALGQHLLQRQHGARAAAPRPAPHRRAQARAPPVRAAHCHSTVDQAHSLRKPHIIFCGLGMQPYTTDYDRSLDSAYLTTVARSMSTSNTFSK